MQQRLWRNVGVRSNAGAAPGHRDYELHRGWEGLAGTQTRQAGQGGRRPFTSFGVRWRVAKGRQQPPKRRNRRGITVRTPKAATIETKRVFHEQARPPPNLYAQKLTWIKGLGAQPTRFRTAFRPSVSTYIVDKCSAAYVSAERIRAPVDAALGLAPGLK
jgi:hypothetical protein